jgi:hypothetical protein
MRTQAIRTATRWAAISGSLVIGAALFVVPGAQAQPGTITGQAFNDFAADGSKGSSASTQVDTGLAGVTVTAYDNTGASCGTTTTTANGSYSLAHTCTNTAVRVEFTTSGDLLDGMQAGPIGAPGATGVTSGSTVQIVGPNATEVNAGFLRPTDYCGANPELIASCFFNGSANNDIARKKSITKWAYGADDPLGSIAPPDRNGVANREQLGAIYGIAVSRSEQIAYVSAVLRRHIGMGPGGIGAIYSLSDANAVTTLKDLSGVVGTFDENARRLGNAAEPNHDDRAAEEVGKIGIGDLDISEDGTTLYFANLLTGEVMSTPANSSTETKSLGKPDPGCPASKPRPWGLAIRGSKIYSGVVCEDATVGAIMSQSLSGGTWTTEVTLPFPSMDSPDSWGGDLSKWVPWTAESSLKQPMITDIEFDADGSMTIGLADRVGYITGSNNYGYRTSDLQPWAATGGDTLRSCWDGTAYILESGGKCGPFTGSANNEGIGGGEFYGGDTFGVSGFDNGHHEISNGALAILPGSNEVVSSVFDPNEWLTSGTRTFSQTDGSAIRNYQLTAKDLGNNPTDGEPGALGKAHGVGDVELLCDQAPIEIGNRVWNDANGNGVQDPTESPIAGVSVDLKSGTTVLSTAVTDAQGNYSFSSAAGTSSAAQQYGVTSLTAKTAYTIDIAAAQTALAGLVTTSANVATSSDRADSDGTKVSTNGATFAYNTGLAGWNDHTIDFGFSPAPLTFSVGNRVFLDTDNSGARNGAEAGIAAVKVCLFASDAGGTLTAAVDANNAAVAQQTTDGDGYYRFDNLLAGNYVVVICDPTQTALLGLSSSTGASQSGTPDNNTDADDNGLDTVLGAGSVAPGGIRSGVITLGPTANEPTTEAELPTSNPAGEAPNAQSNLTVDFGFYRPVVAPLCSSIGNFVWNDTNRNGIQDTGETGVQRVTATLTDANGAAVTDCNSAAVAPQQTDANGAYLFTNLPAGTYKVTFSTLPTGYVFSPADATAGTDATDSDANTTTGMTGNYTLAAGDNNLTVDAGINQPVVAPQPATLGNFVWNDTNRNGIQDTGETGVQGVTATLTDANGAPVNNLAGNTVVAQQTDANGAYLFSNLAAGTYKVTFSTLPTGYVFSPTDATAGTDATDSDANTTTGMTGNYTLAAGDNNLTVDAGINQPVVAPLCGKLGDRVFNDTNRNGQQDGGETGVQGVTATLTDANGAAVTDCNSATVAAVSTDNTGMYMFSNLPAGTYKVTFSNLPSGYVFSPADAGADATDSDANTTTGMTGNYTLAAGETNLTVDAGINQPVVAPIPATLGNFVWFDTNRNGIQDTGETGVQGVTATLTDANGASVSDLSDAVVAAVITNGSGNYLFSNLRAGTYKVTFSNLPAGYVFSPADATAGTDATDSDANTTTGMTGNYTLAAGDNNLTVDAGINQPVVAPLCSSIGNFVWNDTNRNGIQDTGETGVQGVTATLTDANGAAVTDCNSAAVAPQQTDANGAYLFTNLAAGTYKVTFSTLPTGYVFSPADAGADATDSDANTTTGMTGNYTLAAGDNNLTVDAGINQPATPAATTSTTLPVVTAVPVTPIVTAAPATAAPTTVVSTTAAPTTVAPTTVAPVAQPTKVTGVVFVDTNNDGVQNPGEKSLPNVIVEIRDPQGKLIGTVTTDSNGMFMQPVPTDGNYTVTIISGVPPEYTFLTNQQTTVKVLGTTSEQAVFRVNTEVSAVAFTGSNPTRNLLVAFGAILLGVALLGSLRLRKEQA